MGIRPRHKTSHPGALSAILNALDGILVTPLARREIEKQVVELPRRKGHAVLLFKVIADLQATVGKGAIFLVGFAMVSCRGGNGGEFSNCAHGACIVDKKKALENGNADTLTRVSVC